MSVHIEIDEKKWAEAKSIAKELNIDCEQMLMTTLHSNLMELREARSRAEIIAEKDRIDREAYEKYPITEEERQELAEWEEIQDWGDDD